MNHRLPLLLILFSSLIVLTGCNPNNTQPTADEVADVLPTAEDSTDTDAEGEDAADADEDAQDAENTGDNDAANADETIYELDPAESIFLWTGRKVTGSHWGYMTFEEGSLVVADGQPVRGTFIVDMTSMTTEDVEGDGLLNHLQNEDFFDVPNHPEATLEIIQFTERPDQGDYLVRGNLTIKDIKVAIAFPAQVTIEDETATAQASFSLDRTRWNIRYGSIKFFSDIGDKAIDDEFDVSIDAVLQVAQ